MYACGLRAVIPFGVFCMMCCVGTFAGFAYVHVQMCIMAETDHTLWLQNTGPTICPYSLRECLCTCVRERDLF